RSPEPPRTSRLGIDTIVGDIRALCAYRGVTQATFLGQSMGGAIALAVAQAAPALARAVILLASPGRDVGGHLPAQPLANWLWQGAIVLNKILPNAVKFSGTLSRPLAKHPALFLAMREVVRLGGFNPSLARTDDIDEYLSGVLAVDPNLFF